MTKEELKAIRKKTFADMEDHLLKGQRPEDSLFYHHSSEDRIVISHALFLVMSRSLTGKISKAEHFLLIRKYQEEMLSAYLTESEDFPDLLHYCNVMYEYLPIILKAAYDLHTDTNARRLAATTIVAGGYGGDMPEELLYDLLDDMDFLYNKVKCRKIELLRPQLNKMVEEEMRYL